jgi:hypothetical protein
MNNKYIDDINKALVYLDEFSWHMKAALKEAEQNEEIAEYVADFKRTLRKLSSESDMMFAIYAVMKENLYKALK